MTASNQFGSFGIEPGVSKFLSDLAKSGDQSLSEVGVEQARADQLRNLQTQKVATLPANIEDIMIPGGPEGDVSIRIVRPINSQEALPVILYFHGGGWVLSDKNTHDRVIREIAHGARAAIVFVNYSRSPETRYPVANEQAYAVTEWVAEHGHTKQLDSSRMAVVGDSVGGNMATVVCLMAKERAGPEIAYQVLLCPTTDAGFDTPSYQQFSTGFMLSRETMMWFWDQYDPDKTARNQPSASPLKATAAQLKGLPPALIITAEFDVLRDEAEAYAHKLSASGVAVTATRYLGTIHNFMSMNVLMNTESAKAATAQVNAQLRHVFAK